MQSPASKAGNHMIYDAVYTFCTANPLPLQCAAVLPNTRKLTRRIATKNCLTPPATVILKNILLAAQKMEKWSRCRSAPERNKHKFFNKEIP